MSKSRFQYSLYLLISVVLFLPACQGQVQPDQLATASESKGPVIVGNPPAPHPGPVSDPGVVGQYIRCIFQDSKGRYWFGPAGESVASFDGDTLRYYDRADFFRDNDQAQADWSSVHAIAEDHTGRLWFGTDRGVVRYDGKSFRSYTEEQGLTNLYVGRQSILVDKLGTVWVGTRAGVFRYHPAADTNGGKCFTLFELLPPIHVRDIMEDRAGNIWFASGRAGVFRYTPESEQQGGIVQNITARAGLGAGYAGGIAQDAAGNMWFTMEGGFCRYDGQRFTDYTTADGLGGAEVWGIIIETSGIIWITARGSTTRFDPSVPASSADAFTVYTKADNLNCCVQSMYEDRSGNMWWGTGQGLYRFDGRQFYQVKQAGPW
ncbi:MAG: two-component regulator propeller domain-containing protein [Bacteroidota bacterium]